MNEKNYDFRARIDTVHPENLHDRAQRPAADETIISSDWRISPRGAALTGSPAEDLRDFLFRSMELSLAFGEAEKMILLEETSSGRNFEWEITPDRIVIRGNARRGVYWLEEEMTYREAPCLKQGKGQIEALFSPRMVHSGWGLDQYPNSHLNAIAHAGFDSILLFAKGPGITANGHADFNDIIRRASEYGLGVYFYSYLNSYKHPDESDAEEFFDRQFGSMFKLYPRSKGIVLVGESCKFPSRDPKRFVNGNDQAGFFPASDYPDWLECVKKAVRRYSPEADVVFWTYNFGRAPKKERLELIGKLPADISLEATYEMYEYIQRENHLARVPDYTITFSGPGEYFTSEAEAASERNIPFYAMTNTAGMTWDCGVIPYLPVLQQWGKRFKGIVDAHKKWNLAGLMESHHYGWFPGPVQECAKLFFRSPETDFESVMKRVAEHFYGKAAAPIVIEGWSKWSEAINSYTPGFDDQTGPLRIGPSYPFLFEPVLYPYTEIGLKVPSDKNAYFGNGIVNTPYFPEQLTGYTYAGLRLHEDIRMMSEAIRLWDEGNERMRKALVLVPEKKKDEAMRQIGIGFFFGHTLRTTVHTKRWWILNRKLEIEPDRAEANRILDEMESILQEELRNAEETLPLVENDSRLGWEPSMEYMCDPEHIQWKIAQVKRVIENILPAYRKTINL